MNEAENATTTTEAQPLTIVERILRANAPGEGDPLDPHEIVTDLLDILDGIRTSVAGLFGHDAFEHSILDQVNLIAPEGKTGEDLDHEAGLF